MSFRGVPTFGADIRTVAEVVNNLLRGKTNNTGTVTLAASSATTTTLDNALISPESVIVLMPTTANAAAWMNDVYVSARANGSATLTHSANTATDRTYAFAVIG